MVTLPVTLGIRTIQINFHVLSGKLSYNLILGRPWLHDMDVVPSILHGQLKYEYEGRIHTIIGDLEPYALYNIVDLNIEGLDLNYPKF